MAQALEAGNVAAELNDAYADEPDDKHAFNVSILCCIPKRRNSSDSEEACAVIADSTRPLSLVDVANRIVAAAYKMRWEPRLASWISAQQRRLMCWTWNTGAMLKALSRPRGILLLLDFKAAFPSVSHRYMRHCLERYGLPPNALRVIDFLYDASRCRIAVKGSLYDGFDMSSGVRQGCPLSPVLFAAVMDLLLRILSKRQRESATIRAFADDVGVVLDDVDAQFPILTQALDEFGSISGMRINVPKTFGIPLWEDTLPEAKSIVASAATEWSCPPLARAGLYLGVMIGPDNHVNQWDKACGRFRERISGWAWSSLGLHFAAAAYTTCALPPLAFTAQIAGPTDELLLVERWALRRAAPGPGKWVLPSDLWC